MLRADFIKRSKNHINIGARDCVASADAALAEVFINRHIVKQHFDHDFFYFEV